MADIMSHLLARRSIRRFTDEPVSQGELRMLLEAGMAAPSASNRRPWEFVVVTDPLLLANLRDVLILGRYGAPAAIVACGNLGRALPFPVRDFWIQDCSAATQNILLAATGLGLGAVWIGVHPIALFVKAVSRVLAIPRGVVPLNTIWVGHPAEAKAPRTQYDERRVHWQQYAPARAHRRSAALR
jgi:nitroreductase